MAEGGRCLLPWDRLVSCWFSETSRAIWSQCNSERENISVTDLKQFLDNGALPIVSIKWAFKPTKTLKEKLLFWKKSGGHLALVVGYEEKGFYVNHTSITEGFNWENRLIPLDEFKKGFTGGELWFRDKKKNPRADRSQRKGPVFFLEVSSFVSPCPYILPGQSFLRFLVGFLYRSPWPSSTARRSSIRKRCSFSDISPGNDTRTVEVALSGHPPPGQGVSEHSCMAAWSFDGSPLVTAIRMAVVELSVTNFLNLFHIHCTLFQFAYILLLPPDIPADQKNTWPPYLSTQNGIVLDCCCTIA